jgi:hypothetical protein
MAERRFPPPWSVEELDACFVVQDGAGQKLAYGMLILLLLMRRAEKPVYDSLRLRDHLLSLRLILRIGKFRAIEKRSRFSNARFETGLV